MGWDTKLVELRLASLDKNAVRAAYNHALHLKEQRLMMQAWPIAWTGYARTTRPAPLLRRTTTSCLPRLDSETLGIETLKLHRRSRFLFTLRQGRVSSSGVCISLQDLETVSVC